MYKARLIFTKSDEASYISHLDLMKVLQRSLLRAKLPVKYSEGFNPHICLSILFPLSTGYRSEYELCDFELTSDGLPQGALGALRTALPSGIKALELYPAQTAPSLISSASFAIRAEGGVAAEMRKFFDAPIMVEKKSKRGSKEANLLDYIRKIDFSDVPGGTLIECVLAAGDDPLNPAYIVAALRNGGLLPPDGSVEYTRTAILSENGGNFR